MKQRFSLFILLCLCTIAAVAQKVTLSGVIMDGSLGEPLPGASVVLLQPKDSVQVTGISSDMNGKFKLPSVKAGPYIMRVSYMGFQSYYRNIQLSKTAKDINLGSITLEEDSKMMKEAQVEAKLAQVEMKEDTFVFNADAYRMTEGSMLEELVKKLPGAEVEEDGSIKINGKSISKIMVDGKEFFENDTKMAMKNLPAKLIKKLKAYDKKSDYTRITGIDDGEEETVLDLSVKKGMKDGWIGNLDLGYGTQERYTGKFMINRFMDNSQFSLLGSRNNSGDRGFGGPGGRGWGGGGGGISTNTMVGANFAWDNGKPEYSAGQIKMGGNVRYSDNKNYSLTTSNSENFRAGTKSTFSNSRNENTSRSYNFNVDYRFEWMADSMTNVMVQPRYSHSQNRANGGNISVEFNQDPYGTYFGRRMNNPLLEYNMEENKMIMQQIGNFDNHSSSKSNGDNDNVSVWTQVNRRLNKPGRNLTLNIGADYTHSTNNSFSLSQINYYNGGTGNKFTNQYNLSPSTTYNIRPRISYTEPIIGALNLQLSYQFQYRYNDNDRSMFSIDSLLSKFGGYYTQEDLYLGYIPGLDTLELVRNLENSQYATYKEYNHDASIMFRYNVGENRVNFGVSLQPQTTYMDYFKKQQFDIKRTTFNWAPRVDYRWKISNISQLRIRFNGRMQQPSMTNLLPVVDSSNPTRYSTGNADLRSSWTNNLNAFYNGGILDKQMNWSVNADWSQTSNSISTATIVNDKTHINYSRPMNISGNWNARGGFSFSSAIDPKKAFNVNSFTNFGYSNSVGYQSSSSDGLAPEWNNIYRPDGTVDMDYIFNTFELIKFTTKATNIDENLRFNYRNDILEAGLNGGFNYRHSRNQVQPTANLDTWSFTYGTNFTINCPWGTTFSTDLTQQSRRGYQQADMNTNELLWNAQISQSFLKGRAATISIEWYDILRERSNISRNITAFSRSDTWTNAINSYVMVHFIYRLNLIGNKEARAAGFGGGGYGGPGGFGGGFGGGRGRF